MRRLTLLRHGHAVAQADHDDFERPLDARGRLEAAHAAAKIVSELEAPDLMIASAALRTQQTATIVREHALTAGISLRLVTERRLYHASSTTLLVVLSELPADVRHLLLVGHNPGISELALRFADALLGPDRFNGFATAGWCSVTFDAPLWSAIDLPLEGRFESTPR